MKKNVGLVTLPGNYNYGNRLQNYATSKLFEDLSYKPETLLYSGKSLLAHARHFVGGLLYGKGPEELMSKERKDRFAAFSELIPTREVTGRLSAVKDAYDFFAVGSDQVWNPRGIDSYQFMFLTFADRAKRLTIAPSLGVSEIPDAYSKHMIKKGLMGFDNLTCREKAGADLIYSLTGKKATVTVDPTMMLSPASWRSVSSDDLTPDAPYIFSYTLGEMSDDQKAYMRDLENRTGAERVIYLSDRSKPGEIDAGPAEFISLIDHAEHVVTDSFHAAVFSLLMSTPFTIFKRVGTSNSMFSRLETLTSKFNCAYRIHGDVGFDAEKSALAPSIENDIVRERALFMDELAKTMPTQARDIIAKQGI